MKGLGTLSILGGMILIAAGLLFILLRRLPYFRNVPGDLYWRGRYETLTFPIIACVILSIILTLVLNFIFRLLD